MNSNGHHFGWETWHRFKRSIGAYLSSRDGRKSVGMLVLLVAFLVVINGLNVVNSYVGRDFISAIENRDRSQFISQAWLYVGVFVLSTVTTVIYRYLEERLGLLWRTWQTRQILDRYLAQQAYYRIEDGGQLENPDQRIAEDVRSFTATTLSFVLMMLNASFTVVAFSGVLWSISPRLFVVAVVYALIGSMLTVLLGRRLIGLNNQQLDKEANFRSDLMKVRANAGSVALLHREGHVHHRLMQRFDEIVGNTRRMISVNRNLGYFTNGYNYLMQIIPALIVAPLFMQGDVPFGVVTQSAMAFSALMGAFSLAITQFQQISSYAAVIGRLGRLVDAMDHACAATESPIEVREQNGSLVYERLTLRNADGQVSVRELSLTIKRGQRVLITGARGAAKLGLFKATAGLQCQGEGRITRPDPSAILFVPELPYLPHGSLRDLLLRFDTGDGSRDGEMLRVLQRLHLDSIVDQTGGLGIERDWSNSLGISEQAGLVVARVLLAKPQFVFFDRMNVAMDHTRIERVLRQLIADDITYIVIGKPADASDYFDAALHIEADGSWTWRSLTKMQTAPA
ncbi:MAG: ABC transporter transmembrane domain-containing protein [Sinimarinibacterium sp.]|jgi:putative ATP-binding cassette transporter